MATLNEAISAILVTDGQSAVAGSLGVLLEYNAATKPDVIFFKNGPDKPVLPILTYSKVSATLFFPKTILFGFTAWGNNFEAIQKRIFDLFHKRLNIVTSDYKVRAFLFDSDGPDLWDRDLKAYFRQDTYRAIVVREPYPLNTGSNA